MSPDRLDNLDDLGRFLAAADEALAAGKEPPEPDPSTPPELLDRLRRGQAALRWLAEQRRRGEPPPVAPSAALPLTFDPATGTGRLGRFRILRELGRGAHGVVYHASDTLLGREVALKVPRAEAVFDAELRRRFLQEARAAAGLDHPNLVPVLEADEVGPFCYIASACCHGPTLAAWLLRRSTTPVPPRDAAALLAPLAGAVHYIHGKGVLHRDIKPGNILLEPKPKADEPPVSDSGNSSLRFVTDCEFELSACIPRLTDFGLAKLVEAETQHTKTGAMLGTPAYMAPEQADGRLATAGPATDVYALGVVLYEVLTGRPPFQGATALDTLRQVLADDPPPPRKLRADVPRDLETICLKCLEKEPRRRYASAGELAEDLHCFLGGRRVRARRPGLWGNLLRWARRRPLVAALATLTGAALLGLVVGAVLFALQVNRHNAQLADAARREHDLRTLAEQHERLTRQQLYVIHLKSAQQAWESGQPGPALDLLQRERPEPGQEDLRGFAWHYMWQVCTEELLRLPGHQRMVVGVALSADGRTLASAGSDRTVRLWDAHTGQPRASFTDYPQPVLAVAFSPDGRLLASGSGDMHTPGEVVVRDALTGLRLDWPRFSAAVNALAFSPDGRLLAAGGATGNVEGTVKLWEVPSGREVATLKTTAGHVIALAFAPDSRTLAWTPGTEIRLWTASTRNDRVLAVWGAGVPPAGARYTRPAGLVTCLAYAPDGRTLAAGERGGEVTLWDPTAEREPTRVAVGLAEVWAVAFSPDDRTLAVGGTLNSGGLAAEVKLWDLSRQTVRASLRRPGVEVRSLAFTPDGKSLAVGGADGQLALWHDPARRQPQPSPAGHLAEAWSVAFSPDGRTLASGADDSLILLWDAATGRRKAALRGHSALVSCVAFSPDGRTLASGSYDHTIRLWDAAAHKPRAVLRGHGQAVRCLAFSPDGKTLATGGKDGMVKLWDVQTQTERLTLGGHTDHVRALAFACDGLLASASQDGTIRLWDARTGQPAGTFTDSSEVWCLAFTDGGKKLASGSKAGAVKLWDVPGRKLRTVLRGHQGGVKSVAFSPDGRVLASGGEDRSIKLWHVPTAEESIVLRGHRHGVNSVAFSPDGKALASCSHDGAVKLWRAE